MVGAATQLSYNPHRRSWPATAAIFMLKGLQAGGTHLQSLDALVRLSQQVRVRVRRAADVDDALRLLRLQLALRIRV
jgi:hypothetical protein